VRDLLAAYLVQYPVREVTLPWGDLEGTPTTVPLIISGVQGGALNRNSVNHYVWKPALTKVGVRAARENGMHALRHHYASVLLDAGESIKAVSEYLGHIDAGFTLRTPTSCRPATSGPAARSTTLSRATWALHRRTERRLVHALTCTDVTRRRSSP
jgi:integrase